MTPEDIAQITAIVTAAEERITAKIQEAEERAQEFARGIETNLLTSFHGHAKGQTARLHTAETVAQDYGVRLAAIEERLLNLGNPPPVDPSSTNRKIPAHATHAPGGSSGSRPPGR
jgi:hypothetical protein